MFKPFAIGFCLLGAVASDALAWTTPFDVSAVTGAPEVSTPRIARANTGADLHAIWIRKSSPWQIRYRPYEGGAWGTNVQLNSVFGVRPDVCVDTSNRVHAVWAQQNGASSKYDLVHRIRTSGSWNTVAFITVTDTLVEDEPRIMCDSAGVVHLVYTSGSVESSTGDILYRTWNGSWSGAMMLGTTSQAYYGRPDVSIDTSNNVHVIWSGVSGGNTITYYRKKTGGTWGGTVTLGSQPNPGSFYAYARIAAINAGGTVKVAAVWHNTPSSGTQYVMQATSQNGGSSWTAAASLSNGHYPAMDGRGTYAHVVFESLPSAKEIMYRRWDGTSWTAAEQTTPAGSTQWKGWPDVVEDNNGAVHVVYDGAIDPNTYHQIPEVNNASVPPPVWSASFVSLSAPSSMTAGSTATVTVTFNNNGNQTWDTTSTKVGTSNPRDRSSAFYNSADWQSAARPTTVNATTAPGANGSFTFIAKAPTTTGSYSEQFELLQEGVTWFGGTGDDFTWNVTVTAATGTISGTVTASGGGAISGATVSTNVGGYTTTTNASGQYTLSNVAAGTYNVTASKSGYNSSTVNGVVVTSGATTTVNFTLTSSAVERVVFGNMEGGFWDTGWGGGSKIPNGWQGWFNPGDFNCFDEITIKHGGAHSAKTTIAAGGNSGTGGFKRGIIQNITMSPSASFTFTVWAYHTNGNCPSIMCWNPDGDTDPEHAYAAGRYQWVTTDNWGQLNTWVTRSMTGTGPASGNVTIICGGAHHGGGGQGVVYIEDVSWIAP